MNNTLTICYSKNEFYLEEHIKNIGCEYKLIIYDSEFINLNNIITKENRYIVFINKKIYINENNWGLKILELFTNTNYDMIGVVGSIYLDMSFNWYNVIDKIYGDFKNLKVNSFKYRNNFKNFKECVVLDSNFICLNNEDNRIDLIDKTIEDIYSSLIYFNLNLFFNGYNIGITNMIDISFEEYSTSKISDKYKNNIICDFSDYLPIDLYDYKLYDIMIGNLIKEINN